VTFTEKPDGFYYTGEFGSDVGPFATERDAINAARTRYDVVRFYRDALIRRRTILSNVSLEQAQKHCANPETSSSTATSSTARARTRRLGAWFDGYEGR